MILESIKLPGRLSLATLLAGAGQRRHRHRHLLGGQDQDVRLGPRQQDRHQRLRLGGPRESQGPGDAALGAGRWQRHGRVKAKGPLKIVFKALF